MLTILFVILFLTCVLAPWLGEATNDSRSEEARPRNGWFPALPTR